MTTCEKTTLQLPGRAKIREDLPHVQCKRRSLRDIDRCESSSGVSACASKCEQVGGTAADGGRCCKLGFLEGYRCPPGVQVT
eukprot:186659-Chlamydomonas_euryale.AAC.3